MIRHLVVLLHGQPVAELTRTRTGAIRLQYDAAASRPISLSLPLEEGSMTGQRVETYLRGLIPEDPRALTALGREHHIDPTDVIEVLGVIGKDCAGAVQFCLESEIPAVRHARGELEAASDADIEARLAELRMGEEVSWTMPDEHWSLPGMQSKFAIRQQDGAWYWALGAEPTTHIVKPGVRTLRHQALVEYATMSAAGALGLNVAPVAYTDFHSERAIVIARFDRAVRDGRLSRLHQEDLCQAMGEREKMESAGGPGTVRIIQFLRAIAPTRADGERAAAAFARGFIFNTVAAAPDAHARNYALLLDSPAPQLAPLYDLATGLPYDPAPREFTAAMSVAGEFRFAQIARAHWQAFAASAHLDEAWVLSEVERFTAALPDALRAALEPVDDWDGSVREVRARLEAAFARG